MSTRYSLAVIGWLFAALSLAAAGEDAIAVSENERTTDIMSFERLVVTGSSIKRIEGEGALPVLTMGRREIEQHGIVSAEQLMGLLNINSNGLDNLASNADVVAGAARGNNGATSANLRGQGANATLVLLNGRRIASHGLNGEVIDLNQVPFAAIERVEVLKDGASAIYGTDAIGGVINFILRTDYTGLTASAATDITEDGGGAIHRWSLLGGYGDLGRDRFNVMVAWSVTEHEALRGDHRDFVNTFQPDRGLSPDTRGTPIATVFAISSLHSAISRDDLSAAGRGAGPIDPETPNLRVNGINVVDLPNGPGYAGLDGMGPYDEVLWASPGSKYGSAWDTGRAAVLQQPVRNTHLVTRGTFKLGEHGVTAEGIFGRSQSTKSFSPNQISSSTAVTTLLPDGTSVPNPFFNLAYPSSGADYARVFDALAAYFPEIAPNRGRPLAFRWRAMPAGNREIETRSDTRRWLLTAEGPLSFLDGWEYRAGGSRASSDSFSILGNGYFYSEGFAALINDGTLNPFSYSQKPDALAKLEGVMARGVRLYGGTFTTDQADLTASGPLGELPRGTVMAAVGIDVRRERYAFDGDQRTDANTLSALVFNAPFDNELATDGPLERDVHAVFGELQVPLAKGLDLNPAVRVDRYTGFGRTTNPKIALRYAPDDRLVVRGSYSTGFRVPSFKQMFDPRTETTYVGNDIPDPAKGGVVGPGNEAIHPIVFGGGKADLQPEEAKMFSVGVVFAPSRRFSVSVDAWDVNRIGTIESFGLTTLMENHELFPERFIRDAAGNLMAVDNRWINAGETATRGLDVGLRGDIDALGGKLSGGFDLSYLLEKKSRLIASAPFGPSEVNRFTRSGDVGLRWKHTAFVSYRRGNWLGMLSQIYRDGYTDAVLPGVANGSVVPANWNPKVGAYSLFNFSLSYRGWKHTTVTAGVKNTFNTDPPFSAAYDTNTGAGSSWEPRVADPRGRSFTLLVQYEFF